MTRKELDNLLGRLVTDPGMRQVFFQAPRETLHAHGYLVDDAMLEALVGIGQDALEKFAASVDPSIIRAASPPHSGPVVLRK